MIKNPRHGWCDFTLGDFTGMASYLTNVPMDALDAFIDYYTKGTGVAVFDEEGSYFTLVLTRYNNSIFIIKERNEVQVLDFSYIAAKDLAEELIDDIENDLQRWAAEFTFDDIVQNKDKLTQKIEELKQLIAGDR